MAECHCGQCGHLDDTGFQVQDICKQHQDDHQNNRCCSFFIFQTLEEQCMCFALNHMTQVIQSESFDQLDSLHAKAFIKKAAERGAFRT